MTALLARLRPHSRRVVKDFFNAMQLPLPEADDEFYCATGARNLVFLTDHGIVIRITEAESLYNGENPHFLKPLFSRVSGDCRIDIDPGLVCPVADYEAIYKMMRQKFGLSIGDKKAHNVAYVPGTLFPVIIDLDPVYIDNVAVSSLSEGVAAVKELLPDHENPQITLYAPLREIIARAWPAYQSRPKPEGIREFLETCRNFKQAGKLVASWATNPYWGTDEYAAGYARRLALAVTHKSL